ncbi:M14 family zinc carboxypeptidase [Haloarchaeobius sp. DFWS5]|uniref:M14 family zinc carboxypeptidase n=1 Tax=Haloarchaeobius sp. DFWS5 TaxID=3446114 RepID=UPI003EC12F32
MAGSPSPPVRSFDGLGDAVPRYESFFTVTEHRERGRELADEYDHVTYEEHGESADGETLWTVTVGEGDRSALLFGAPHPNEPMGSMTIDFLTHELAANDDLRASLDYEFICMPVADPDGVRRNQGWFDGPFTLSNYAQNFYRPPPDEQVEATFPIEHEDYAFDEPIPATTVLAEVIDEHSPEFIYSLHNTAFGGCYYYLTEPLEPIHDLLLSIPGDYDVPLDRGEPEAFDTEVYDDAIYELFTFDDMYESVRGDGPSLEEVLFGGNAYDYASRRDGDSDVVQFVAELPYFLDPRVQDQTELDRSREAVIREGVQHRRTLLRELRAAAQSIAEYLPDTAMAEEAVGAIYHFDRVCDDKLEWAAEAEETNEPATVATHVDERFLRQYHLLTYLGMLLRVIDQAAMGADEDVRSRLMDTKAALEAVLTDRLGEMQSNLDYETIPIWKLVAIQARAGLVCLDYRQHRSEE